MPIYRRLGDGTFVLLPHKPFSDLEKRLEDWVEANPNLLFEGEDLAVFARQPRNEHGKFLDLLAVDRAGAVVVVELKRGEAPRDVIAQALEYAAWVDTLGQEQLDEITRSYSAQRNLDFQSVVVCYLKTFPGPEGDQEAETAATRVTFNNRQRIVIMAESFGADVEQTLRYLRTQFGVDIYAIQFGVHEAGGETVLDVRAVVGREAPSRPRRPTVSDSESEEKTRERVKTDFLKQTIGNFDRWLEGPPCTFEVRRGTGSDHYVLKDGSRWAYFYYAQAWMYVSLPQVSEQELQNLQTDLSKPGEVRPAAVSTGVRFHVANDHDLEVFKNLLVRRVEAPV